MDTVLIILILIILIVPIYIIIYYFIKYIIPRINPTASPAPSSATEYYFSSSAIQKLDYNRMVVIGYSVGAQEVSRFYESFPDLKLSDNTTLFPNILAGVMIAGGSMSCYTGDDNVCPPDVTEVSYDQGARPWAQHPPTLLVQSILDEYAPHGKTGATQRYFDVLQKHNVPSALITTGGFRHGICPCAVDPIVNFIQEYLTQNNIPNSVVEKFEKSNTDAWQNFCAPYENSTNYEECPSANKIDCNAGGCCWDPKGKFKCFRPSKPDKNNLSWNGGKNPDLDYFRNLFESIKNNTIIPHISANKVYKKDKICNDELVSFSSHPNFPKTENCGLNSSCTLKTSARSKDALYNPSIPKNLVTAASSCSSTVKVGTSNICPNYVQYWYNVLDKNNIIWEFSDNSTYKNSRQTAIALPTCTKMPENGWPWVLYLSFANPQGESEGWGPDIKSSGGLISINKDFPGKDQYGRLELTTIFNSLLVKGIAIVFAAELIFDTYFYAGGT